jgi:hypothetical protein
VPPKPAGAPSGAGAATCEASGAYFQICLPVTAFRAYTPLFALKYITLSMIIGAPEKRPDSV